MNQSDRMREGTWHVSAEPKPGVTLKLCLSCINEVKSIRRLVCTADTGYGNPNPLLTGLKRLCAVIVLPSFPWFKCQCDSYALTFSPTSMFPMLYCHLVDMRYHCMTIYSVW